MPAAPHTAEQQPNVAEQPERQQEQRSEQLEALSSSEIAERIGELAAETMQSQEARVLAYEQAVANLGERLPEETRMEVTGLLESTRPQLERLQLILDILRDVSGVQLESRAQTQPSAEAEPTLDNAMPGAEQRIPVSEVETASPDTVVAQRDLDVAIPVQRQTEDDISDDTVVPSSSDQTDTNQTPVSDVIPPDRITGNIPTQQEDDEDSNSSHTQAGPGIKLAA